MSSKRNGGIELKSAFTMGFGRKKEVSFARSRSATEEELEEKILRPSSPHMRRKSMIPHSVPGYVKYRQKGNQRARRLRADLFHFLEGCRTFYSALYHVFVFLIILASLAMAIMLSMNEFKDSAKYQFVMLKIEYVLLGIFFVEYLLRLWSSSAHGHYSNFLGKVRYILTPHMILDLLIMVCSVGLIYGKHLDLDPKTEKLMHMLLLLRILRVDRQNRSFAMFKKVFLKHRKELLTCWYMSFIMIMFVAILVYALETDPKDVTVNNLFNGFYWGVISLASIGYGDISPNTAIAKILICVIAVFGTAFFAMPAGIIGSGFALQVAEHQKEKHINRKRRPAAVLIQSFWRRYAGDHDLHATWLRHMVDRESRRITKQRIIKSQDVLQGHIPLSAVTASSKPTSVNGSRSQPVQLQKLTLSEKNALRFIRRLKIRAALKLFRQARRPYDERDILDQFAAGQVEMFAKLRMMGSRVERISLTVDRQTKIVGESTGRVSQLEEEVTNLRDIVVDTKDLLEKLYTVLAPPNIQNQNTVPENCFLQKKTGKNELAAEEKKLPVLKKSLTDDDLLTSTDEEIFVEEPDEESLSDAEMIVDLPGGAVNQPPKRRFSADKLRIMADMHNTRLLSIDSAKSTIPSDCESIDSAL
ncbi:potassium voltage-gated channel subfamily KQT member 5-like [Rhopilema esculentum]|uniref:potassium voltage-gated channel subfamily KQT member 5-like n=1 Tax=Rhopilema esculentum TaxID=499914 RepID=UPI0031CE0716|eukprot:gene8336-14302_t